MSRKRKIDGDYNDQQTRQYSRGTLSVRPHDEIILKYDKIPIIPSISAQYEKPVFTHMSQASQEFRSGPMLSYDRLEFLGDAYLETMATRTIWESYQNMPVGKMARIRETMIKNETLSKFSLLYDFDKKVKLSQIDQWAQSSIKTKIFADLFEAYVAAVILSDPVRGFQKAEEWLNELWKPVLQQIDTKPTDLKSKDDLAKKVLAPGVKISYVDEAPRIVQKGQGIESYFIGAYLTGWGYENCHLGSGTGLSKSAAGMAAAAQALEQNKKIIEEIAAKKKAFYVAKREREQRENGQGHDE